MRKSSLEKLREAKRKKATQVQMTLEGLMLLLLDGDREPEDRSANPTQAKFILEPPADGFTAKAYKGPAGCAKTSTIVAAGILRSLFMPGSKGLIARQDYNDLMDTTAGRFMQMIERLPPGIVLDRDKSPPMKVWLRPIETFGSDEDFEPSQITFMGLKDGFGSYEFDWAIIDEADEADEKRVQEILTRFRGKAGIRLKGAHGAYVLMLAFNPPGKEHWLYRACTGRDHQDRKVCEPWMDLYEPVAEENVRNLPDGYYINMAKGLPEDMKQRLIRGEWGSTFPGQPVYREFKKQVHAATHSRDRYDPEAILYRFWDFGYNHPACLFFQQDHRSRLLGMGEFYDEKVEIQDYASKVLAYTNTHFPGAVCFDIGDPAARQKKDTGSTIEELSKAGIQLRYITGRSIEDGIRKGRTLLERMIDGEPAMQFDPRYQTIIINALQGGYHLDQKTGTKPVKDGFYDHPADAWRYGIDFLYRNEGIDLKNLPSSIAFRPGARR